MPSMITTVDNPYDPRTDFRAWYMWDTGHGYNTSAYLDRVAAVAEEFPEAVRDRNIEDAIDEIIAIHNGGMYKKLMIEEEGSPPSSEQTPETSSAA